MKKLKLNLKDVGEILTREQLKQVFGGSGAGCQRFRCVCNGSVGSWHGTYCTGQEIVDAIRTWCASQQGDCIPSNEG